MATTMKIEMMIVKIYKLKLNNQPKKRRKEKVKKDYQLEINKFVFLNK